MERHKKYQQERSKHLKPSNKKPLPAAEAVTHTVKQDEAPGPGKPGAVHEDEIIMSSPLICCEIN